MSGFPYALLLPEKHAQGVGISRFPMRQGKQLIVTEQVAIYFVEYETRETI